MILDVIEFVKSNSTINYYPNSIPLTETGEIGLVRLVPRNTARRSNLVTMDFQVIIRALHPERGELLGKELMNNIGPYKTGFKLGDFHVVRLETTSVFPLFIGKDENDRYKYSMDFSLLIEK